MLSTLIETKQKLSVLIRGYGMAIRNRSLHPSQVQIGTKGVYRTAKETQEYLKNSSEGKALGVSHLL